MLPNLPWRQIVLTFLAVLIGQALTIGGMFLAGAGYVEGNFSTWRLAANLLLVLGLVSIAPTVTVLMSRRFKSDGE